MLRACGAVLEDLHVKRQQQQLLVDELTAKGVQLREARDWEQAIVPQIFQGAAGDARENQLEAEVDAMLPRLHQTRQFFASYSQAYELTRSARGKLTQASELLQGAFGLANVDVMGNIMHDRRFGPRSGPVERMADMKKRAMSRQGSQLAAVA